MVREDKQDDIDVVHVGMKNIERKKLVREDKFLSAGSVSDSVCVRFTVQIPWIMYRSTRWGTKVGAICKNIARAEIH